MLRLRPVHVVAVLGRRQSSSERSCERWSARLSTWIEKLPASSTLADCQLRSDASRSALSSASRPCAISARSHSVKSAAREITRESVKRRQ